MPRVERICIIASDASPFISFYMQMRHIGFRIARVRAEQNPWVIKNRWCGKVMLYQKNEKGTLRQKSFPATNIVIVAEK